MIVSNRKSISKPSDLYFSEETVRNKIIDFINLQKSAPLWDEVHCRSVDDHLKYVSVVIAYTHLLTEIIDNPKLLTIKEAFSSSDLAFFKVLDERSVKTITDFYQSITPADIKVDFFKFSVADSGSRLDAIKLTRAHLTETTRE